jgi:hypothetical protein
MKAFWPALLFCLIIAHSNAQNVGIGTSVPSEKLHVTGNLRFDGALMPNNLPGALGQALISQGPGIAPIWESATAGQQFTTYYSTGSVTPAVNGAFPPVDVIPGLSQNVTIPAIGTYDVFIYVDGGAQLNTGTTNAGAQLEVSIWIDGVARRYMTTMVDNPSNLTSGIRTWASSYFTNLTAGVHNIEIRVRHRTAGGTLVTVGAPNVVGNYLICSMAVGLIKR